MNSFGYFLNQGIKSVIRNKMMSISTIVTVFISLSLVTSFIYIIMFISGIFSTTADSTEISIYIKADQELAVAEGIVEDLKLAKGVNNVEFILPVDAVKNFAKINNTTPEELKERYGSDAFLPYTINVTVEDDKYLKTVGKQAEANENVDKVKYPEKVVAVINQITKQLKIFGSFFIILLLFSSIYLIYTNIKLSVYGKRKEIMVMKYVGSSDGFIKGPFLVMGLIYGFLGSLLAAIITSVAAKNITSYLAEKVSFISTSFGTSTVVGIGITTIVIGLFMGTLGSYLSIRKYLKV